MLAFDTEVAPNKKRSREQKTFCSPAHSFPDHSCPAHLFVIPEGNLRLLLQLPWLLRIAPNCHLNRSMTASSFTFKET